MRNVLLLLAAAVGISACAARGSAEDSALCLGLGRDARALHAALLAHPQTPQAVGEAGTDLVIAFAAGCDLD